MSESHPSTVELDLLREFYANWVGLHTLKRDAIHRRKQESAAQELVDSAHALRIFYHHNAERSPLASGLSADGR